MWQVTRAKYTDAEAIAAIAAANTYLKKDGSEILTADWDIGDGRKMLADEIGARDGDGLKLCDDGGVGLFVKDGGQVGVNTITPVDALTVVGEVGVRPAAGNAMLRLFPAAGNNWSFGANATSGIFFIYDSTNSANRFSIDGSGNVGISTTTPTAKLDVDSDGVRLRTAKTPTGAGDTGNQGDFCWDASYVYLCRATDTWDRIPHAWNNNLYQDADVTKLAGIESSADVTDATNVNAAGAVMTTDTTLAVDTISEHTNDHGTTIETVNLKDGHINELKKLILKDPTELTISWGVITVTQTFHTVDTEGDAASDYLGDISGGEEGQILILRAAHNDRTVIVQDGVGLKLAGNFSMDHTYDTIVLIRSGSYWIELSRSNNE